MSILNFLFGGSSGELFSDTNDDGDTDNYMYRLEDDDTYTPVSKDEYKAHTDQLWEDGYYDDMIADCYEEPRKGLFGLW